MSKQGRVDFVEVSGEATIQNVEALCEQLKAALRERASLTLDVSRLTTTDLAFVQLVEAARLTAAEQGEPLALSAPASGELRDVLERGGFLASAQRREFWIREEMR